MALIAEPDFKDGFDAYSAAQVARKWNSGTVSLMIAGRSGIAGSQAARLGTSLVRTVTSDVCGCLQSFWGLVAFGTGTTPIYSLHHSSAAAGVTLEALSSTGVLRLVNRQTLAVIATATDPLQSVLVGTGYYFEFFMKAGGAGVGTLDVYMNGLPVTGLVGITAATISTGTVAIDTIRCETSGGSPTNYFDDVYYRRGPSYTIGGDRLGDLVIETVYSDAASGDAGHNQGTPYGGANAFNGLDEPNTQNDETDGVDLTTIGNKHYTSFGALVGPPGSVISSIKSVQLNIAARRVTPGFSNVIQPGAVKVTAYGTDYLGTAQSLADTFTDIRKAWAVRPDGGGAFVPSDIATGWEWGAQRNA